MPNSTTRKTSPEKFAYWRGHVEGWRSSGLTQQAYCREQGISKNTLCYWVRRLACESGGQKSDANAAPVVVTVAPRQLIPTMTSAMPEASPETAPLRLHVGARFRVDIAGDFAAPVLGKLLRVLLDFESRERRA